MNEWISVEDQLPESFVSVLGFMTDAGDFPPVRECYSLGGKAFFFPALEDVPLDANAGAAGRLRKNMILRSWGDMFDGRTLKRI